MVIPAESPGVFCLAGGLCDTVSTHARGDAH